jgi:hypothetical protein
MYEDKPENYILQLKEFLYYEKGLQAILEPILK